MQEKIRELWLRLLRDTTSLSERQKIIRDLRTSDDIIGIQGQISCFANPNLDSLIDADQTWLDAPNRHLVTYCDKRYPKKLRQIANPPLALFVAGDPELLCTPQIAIVGSRKSSSPGRIIAREFAQALCEQGICITSGLAVGIDGAAHSGALASSGATIAVLANGANIIYPKMHAQLTEQILESQGAIVSEFPVNTPPLRPHFPQRNRIISGMSLGVLIVEAAIRSGSLITARYALEQNREVFVIPGSINNPLAKGCHYLIKQGALLVETVDDIYNGLGWLSVLNGLVATQQRHSVPIARTVETELSSSARQLLNVMGYDAVDLDGLVVKTGFTVQKVQTALLELELIELVCNSSGFFIRNSG